MNRVFPYIFSEFMNMLQRYSDILNTRDDLTDDQYDEMISWFASVEDWTGEIKDMLDASFG